MTAKHQWITEQIQTRQPSHNRRKLDFRIMQCRICKTTTEVPAGLITWRRTRIGRPCLTVHQETKEIPPGMQYKPAICGWAYLWRTPLFGGNAIIRDGNEVNLDYEDDRRYRITCPDCLHPAGEVK